MKLESRKKKMIRQHLMNRGVSDENVLQAFRAVPREQFVPRNLTHLAYNDSPLSIGNGQTISQPYIVALMMQLLELKNTDEVLEIGTGSGYQTALLAEIAQEVYTVERIKELLVKARSTLSKLQYENIYFEIGDGTIGWSDEAIKCEKFDKIIVAAAAPDIPAGLVKQLAMNGKLIIPTGDRMFQKLIVISRTKEGLVHTQHGGCTFVPLIGEQGWNV